MKKPKKIETKQKEKEESEDHSADDDSSGSGDLKEIGANVIAQPTAHRVPPNYSQIEFIYDKEMLYE